MLNQSFQNGQISWVWVAARFGADIVVSPSEIVLVFIL